MFGTRAPFYLFRRLQCGVQLENVSHFFSTKNKNPIETGAHHQSGKEEPIVVSAKTVLPDLITIIISLTDNIAYNIRIDRVQQK